MRKTASSSIAVAFALLPLVAYADGTYQTLPFSQNWTNTGLITVDDDWSGVPGIIGYRGDALTGVTGTDPQTLTLADDTAPVVDVNANRNDPNVFLSGGFCEFELADPTISFQGSGTADAPYLQLHLNTSAKQDITISYNLRDVDGSADNTNQQVALHYRVGTSGTWTNVAAAYVTDASTGPSLATQVTAVSVMLPSDANNVSQLQVRIMTTNAPSNDEQIGIDDITVTGTDVTIAVDEVLWGALKALYR